MFGTARGERTEAADARLRSLLSDSLKSLELPPVGVAVVAHGGYGRSELSAASDLDVLLVHDERMVSIGPVAESLWYPLWDDGVRLDHSVRTVAESQAAAARDIRTAMSLLDSRHVAGDASLTLRLRTNVLADWRRSSARVLPLLRESCQERASRVGELSSLLEPDLKEAHGGLRDGVVLRALAASWLVDIPHTTLTRVRSELLDIRDALHEVSVGRPSDRLLAELQADVATLLDLPDRDALLRKVYTAGRTLGHLTDISWRRVGNALERRTIARGRRGPRPGPPLTPLAPGVVAVDGEVGLAPNARIGEDPFLALRAARAAASRGLLLSPYAGDRLGLSYVPLPEPWPVEARRLFTELLGTGPALLPVWEALDQAGLISAWLPEWTRVRCAPQWSAVHRHTVDRHLLETCVIASSLAQQVSRPDLLLVAALLHDIGKGSGGDHSAVGAPLARSIAQRMGFSGEDSALLAGLVRNHLLLIETATQRDLDDPATVRRVAVEVGDGTTLDLLAALTEADARATGGAAWNSWRAKLLARLVSLVRARLDHGAVLAPLPLEPWQQMLAARGETDVVVEESAESCRITVVAPDRVGLLAAIAGVLGAAGLAIQSAAVHTLGTVGVSVWQVFGEAPTAAVLRERLGAVLSGDLDVAERLATLDETSDTDIAFGAVRVVDDRGLAIRVLPSASTQATVLEVRAPDRPGLFHQICSGLARAEISIRSAHVDTLAGSAVDVFYLVGPTGRPLTEPEAATIPDALRNTAR